MGGRGSLSMSASNGASTSVAVDPSLMTDEQLGNSIVFTRSELDTVGDRLIELSDRIAEARMGPREGRAERIDAAQRAHNEGKAIYDALRDRLGELEAEQARRRQASRPAAQRVFVNSYGEATRRHITTQTYEAAQRRLERQVGNWLSGR